MKKIYSLLLIVSIFLASCSALAPEPTSTPIATATSVPTETPLPTDTSTPIPLTATEDVIAALMPSGNPDSEWNDIPIMPDAINGEGDDKGYTFTIATTSEDVQAFYEKELLKLGFNLFATGEGEGKATVMLIFMKDTTIVSVSIIPAENVLIVLIVK